MSRYTLVGPSETELRDLNRLSLQRYGGFSIELTGALDAMQKLDRIPARILKAQQLALKTLQRDIVPKANRDIRSEYNLGLARVKKGLKSAMVPDGIKLVGKSRGINAIEFGATWKRIRNTGIITTLQKGRTGIRFTGSLRGKSAGGAVFAIKRGKPRMVHDFTFIASGKNGGARLVFERLPGIYYKPVAGWKAGSRSERIEKIAAVYGPSVAQMLKHGRRPERLAEFAIRTLQSEQKRLLGGS